MSLEIANLALDLIGATPLTTLEGSRNPSAGVITRNLDKAVSHVLKRCSWTELTLSHKPQELKVSDPDCDFPEGFCYAWVLPGDFVNVYDVETTQTDLYGKYERDDPHWKIAKIKTPDGPKEALLTDCDNIRMEYICRPADLGTLDCDVIDLIAMQLAIRIIPAIKADKSLKESLRQEFAILLEEAERTSSGQDAERLQIPNGFLTRARVGNYDVLYQPRDERGLFGRGGSRNKDKA